MTNEYSRPSSTRTPSTLVARSSPPRVSSLSSRVLVPTFSVVLPALVCSPSTTRLSCSCSARPSRVARAKRLDSHRDIIHSFYRTLEGGCNTKIDGRSGGCGSGEEYPRLCLSCHRRSIAFYMYYKFRCGNLCKCFVSDSFQLGQPVAALFVSIDSERMGQVCWLFQCIECRFFPRLHFSKRPDGRTF